MLNTPFFRATRRADADGLINLSRRRTWHADEPGAQTNTQPNSGGAPDGAQSAEWRMEDLPGGAQAYIKQLRDENADRRKALTAAEDAARQREQARLQEEGKWKELAQAREAELAKIAPYQERAQALEAMIRAGNETRIKAIPESMRGIVPTDYPPEKLSGWLDANWQLLQPKPAPNLDAGAGGGGKPAASLTEAERTIARNMGLTPEQYAAQKS